ncbi:MAG TPA: hypothetical protein PLA41_00920 [Candidatus Pacearchaeota archaeon]|jgi:hypothetical protein|nr:hypothetical protein [Candidatus Parcubacteria bacterium]HNZ84206.1 hypothetical protein [Candidatus Pacearchaeota archaeon]HOU45693.1 hypothetical protein [Candidatus Pacearchaeota archaeon]HPM08492.1 hypothetical protein [Candidatus Pacearchaeota archaeon]HQI74813.1 hypothetical protein [Candidatus Pacearchaeota archaeon]
MNKFFLTILIISALLLGAFMSYRKNFDGFNFFEKTAPLNLENTTLGSLPEVLKTNAILKTINGNKLILDIDGQQRTALIKNDTQIFLYQQKSQEALASELQKSVEDGGIPPSAGEYIQKNKEDLRENSAIEIESQNNILQGGDIILFKIIIK